LTPEDGVALHHIASLTGANTERAPVQYVEKVFDDYADKFDAHLVQTLNYEAPRKLMELVHRHAPASADKWNVLDLGCGTGLVGLAIAPFARQLVGVDLSRRMLDKARARNLYQRLERLDLLAMMQSEETAMYDVIIAADVFIYLGKLDEIVSEIKRLLAPGAVFAFSVEALVSASNEATAEGIRPDYQLGNTGRYSHSADYLAGLAAASGFSIQEMALTQIRTTGSSPVFGHLALWRN
jgi:predicted TPR repeat methyltransferase